MGSVFKRGGKKNRGGNYYVSWFDHTGKRQSKSAKTTDKATAERIAAKLESDAALRRDGVIDPALDGISQESQRSVESHLSDYKAKLQAANRTEDHIESTAKIVCWISEFGGFNTVSDISADGVNHYAGKMRNEGLAARTIQSHLTAIKAFTKWLSENHKLPRDPLSSVKKPNPKTDRRRERRILLPEEWRRLERATGASHERYGMSSEERLLLYRTAIETGLRSNELRSLTRGRLYFDAAPPYITCKAKSTKNGQDARQYIQPELAADLREHITKKSPKTPVFKLPHKTNLAKMFRDDLAAARKEWIKGAKDDPQKYAQRQESDFLADTNHDGEITDFHCLRHTCGSWLAMLGVHPKVVQTVMRHASITLTMDTYGHLFPGQEIDAVSRMRDIMIGPPESLRATGTDNQSAKPLTKAQRQAQQSGRERQQSGATDCDDKGLMSAQKKTPNPLRIAELDGVVRSDATTDKSRAGGTRTLNQRIMSPVL
jgi:integrase